LVGCKSNKPEVVVYTSVDQIYSEPFFIQFEKDTGIKVLANYDVEASKTTGLVNKLIAEKDNPIADVFWNGEFSQTIRLKEEGILQPYVSPSAEHIPSKYKDTEGYWTAFGGRARVLIINTDLVKEANYPGSIYDLSNKDKPLSATMAKPLFGTTATHAAALYALLGSDEAQLYYDEVLQSDTRIVDGNSVVRDLVANGELAYGITDTDDGIGALKKNKPVKLIFPDQGPDQMGTLIIPNTVAMIKGAKNIEAAQLFMDYILSLESEEKLIEMDWCQMATRKVDIASPYIDINQVKTIDVNLEDIYGSLEDSQHNLKSMFMK